MGLSKKVMKVAFQASTIVRWTMVRSYKAAAAVKREEEDRRFKAYQQELGLLLDNDGEESAPSTLRRLPHGAQWLDLPSNVMGGHRGNLPPG
jgi:hypothetical protein